jgi:glucosamine kinase
MSGWIVGVDAGGTSSRALARNSQTGETRRAQAASSNWTVHGPAVCAERLTGLVRSVLPPDEEPESLALCLAGYYPPDHLGDATRWASVAWPNARIRVEPDYAAAWAGAFAGKPGIIVIAGTGSMAYGRNTEGHEARAGGWGPRFGDEGSAYWIGRNVLALLAREEDEGKRQTLLFERLRAAYPHLGDNRRAWLRGVYRQGWGREEIAALAAHVTAHQGKQTSELLQLAGKELASLARTVQARLRSLGLPVALLGGVGEHSQTVREAFEASISSDMKLILPEAGSQEGALQLAGDC